MLAGERSDSSVYPTAHQLQTVSAGAEVATIAGQSHVAHSMDPNRFISAILDFTSRH